MRKYLTATLSTCLLSATLAGCGEKSQEAQVAEQLNTLLGQMHQLKYADAPSKANALEYTLGKEVDGVKIPGSIRFEAAYLDQALALLPLAEEIKKTGTPLQVQSANTIIGAIRSDEGAFLIDEAERSFQQGVRELIALRSKLGILREIQATDHAVAGDATEIVETYQAGLDVEGTRVAGISELTEQAKAMANLARQAESDFSAYRQKLSALREEAAEYEALELKLVGESRRAQSTDKFDKLDQATAAAQKGENLRAQAQAIEIDAWIADRTANLEQYKHQQLAGEKSANVADLLGKLESFIAQASQDTGISADTDAYVGLKQILDQAKAEAGNSTVKAASFLLALSDYRTASASNAEQRSRLVSAMMADINRYLGVIGTLQMKIAQVKLKQERVADQLAAIEGHRKAVISDFAQAFSEKDTEIEIAGFDRMAASVEVLTQAIEAVKGAGSGHETDLMSLYMIHARALQQQKFSAETYLTLLSSIAEAGPGLLGESFHATLRGRIAGLEARLDQVAEAVAPLQANGDTLAAGLMVGLDPESDRGKLSLAQIDIFQSLIESLAAPR